MIKKLEPILEEKIGLAKKSKPSQKILNYKTKGRQASYTSLGDMMEDVFKDGEVIIPLVNQEIDKIKTKHPQFVAHQFTDEEFDQMQEKLKNRMDKDSSTDQEKVSDEEVHVQSEELLRFPLNQILFGPPGTGKTYHTVNEALQIIGIDISGLIRAEIKEEFDKKIKEGQIVFTTFHQSMSYEEFIEGIKPGLEPEKDGEEVIYKIEPGLFKKLSIEASFDIAKFRKSKGTAEVLDFSNLHDMFIEEVQERLINEEEVELKTKSGGTVLIDSISQQGNIIIKHHNGTRTYTVSKGRLTKLQAAIDSLDSVSNINDEFREVIGGSNSSAYWSVLNAIKQMTKRANGKVEEKTYTYNDKVEVVKKMIKEDFYTAKGKNYVLIIDEINRGNVSQIFGELITLIEEDKRLGKNEALEVSLPYSKEKFGVPPNLYIIGTMNTADRSVEALDTALRRRFSFTEMPPRYDLTGLDYGFAGVKGSEILMKINKRIEKLLDRDHLLGHSYFLLNEQEKQQPEAKLLDSFYRNIIPLLQEYFFGDYAKIGAILGSGFVYAENESDQAEFATGYENEDFAEKDIYQIIDYRPNQPVSRYIQPGMTFEKAIRLLMNQQVEQEIES
ncbi:McrB family protein [Cyclobacterium salsum]|uniref:McrB family protein n=1 Tax=Cyclobacterium salsum TaxID=2666329 RepID=UPI00192EBAA2|nr:AAA family ATPase [Cyclobacterium salsum]